MGGGCYRERCACLCTNTSVCERVYVAECAGWGYAQYKMDPSGQACSGPVPMDGERKEKRWWWWGLVTVGRWGPAGMEQPANEEPSEASIHLEHGALQLPWPWLWSTKMLDPYHFPRATPTIWTACMHMYTYVHTPIDAYAYTRMLLHICMHICSHRYE